MSVPLRQVMGQSYLCFPIRDAVRRELSWTHYRALIRIENPKACDWYAAEAELERDRALLEMNQP